MRIDPDQPILDLETLEAVRAEAMRSVLKPDLDAFLRRIYRAMSEKYGIPLHEIDQQPLLWLLQHYYEGVFEAMEDEDRIEVAAELAETPEERKTREVREEEDEEAFIARQLQEEFAKEAKRPKRKPKKPQPKPDPGEISMGFPDDLDLDGPSVPAPPPRPRNLKG